MYTHTAMLWGEENEVYTWLIDLKVSIVYGNDFIHELQFIPSMSICFITIVQYTMLQINFIISKRYVVSNNVSILQKSLFKVYDSKVEQRGHLHVLKSKYTGFLLLVNREYFFIYKQCLYYVYMVFFQIIKQLY